MRTKIPCRMMVGFLALFFMFSFPATPIFAQGNIHVGQLKVKPSITYKGEYNDNIFYSNANEEEDFIHTITPGITLSYEGTPGNFFTAGYSVDIAKFSDRDENDYEAHKPFVAFGMKSPYGLYLTASDNYISTADPYGAENQFRLGVPQTERYNNTLKLAVGYEFAERYIIEGLYQNNVLRYDLTKDEWQDLTEDIYGGSLFFKITPKTSIFFQYRRTDGVYDSQDDGIFDSDRGKFWSSTTSQNYMLNDYFIGARFAPGGKLSGEIKLGIGEKEFDNIRDVDGNRYQDDDTWVAETNVGYQLKERTNLSLELQRKHQGSPDTDASTYIDTLAGLSLSHGFTDRVNINFGLYWDYQDYQNEAPGRPEKEFDILTFTAGIGYNIKDWLFVGADYKHDDKNAGDVQYETSEYEDNIVSGTVSAIF